MNRIEETPKNLQERKRQGGFRFKGNKGIFLGPIFFVKGNCEGAKENTSFRKEASSLVPSNSQYCPFGIYYRP
jgi:hypothetical protein